MTPDSLQRKETADLPGVEAQGHWLVLFWESLDQSSVLGKLSLPTRGQQRQDLCSSLTTEKQA